LSPPACPSPPADAAGALSCSNGKAVAGVANFLADRAGGTARQAGLLPRLLALAFIRSSA
jgi:hypothetical protein